MKYLTIAAAALAIGTAAAPAHASDTFAMLSSGDKCNADASIDGTPFLRTPDIAQEMGIGGVARVKVVLQPSGKVVSATLLSSTGNEWLDEAALESARLSRFTAQTVSCSHVGGSYLYEVTF
jgi:TonB family protein